MWEIPKTDRRREWWLPDEPIPDPKQEVWAPGKSHKGSDLNDDRRTLYKPRLCMTSRADTPRQQSRSWGPRQSSWTSLGWISAAVFAGRFRKRPRRARRLASWQVAGRPRLLRLWECEGGGGLGVLQESVLGTGQHGGREDLLQDLGDVLGVHGNKGSPCWQRLLQPEEKVKRNKLFLEFWSSRWHCEKDELYWNHSGIDYSRKKAEKTAV